MPMQSDAKLSLKAAIAQAKGPQDTSKLFRELEGERALARTDEPCTNCPRCQNLQPSWAH